MDPFSRDSYRSDKKRASTRFRDNFVKVRRPANNKKGYRDEFVYSGDWYIWTNPQEDIKKLRLLCTVFIPLSLAIFLVAALQPVPVNIHDLAVITSLGSLVTLVLMAYCLVQFYRLPGDMRMTVMMFRDLHVRFRIYTLANCILEAAGFGVGVYLLAAGSPVTVISVLVSAAYLLCAVAAAFIFSRLIKLRYRTEENELPGD